MNRDNGKILPKENLEFYEFVNNKLSPKVILSNNEAAVFKIPENLQREYYRSFLVSQPKTNDFNILQIYGNQYYNEQKNDFKKQAQIFLDRAIYRPGQTVYYKVITTNLVEQKEKVLPNETIEINFLSYK